MMSSWSSESLMTPMPVRPASLGRSGKNLLRNWALLMSWMNRAMPSLPATASPPRRVPRWLW
jgi:hypothetical protein